MTEVIKLQYHNGYDLKRETISLEKNDNVFINTYH